MAQGCNTFKTPEQMASKDVKMPGTEIGENSVSQLEDVKFITFSMNFFILKEEKIFQLFQSERFGNYPFFFIFCISCQIG